MAFEIKVEIAGRVIYGDRVTGWGLTGLEGWWDSAEARGGYEEIPGADGLFSPVDQYIGGGSYVIRGKAVAVSPERGAADRAWLRSLAKVSDLQLRVLEGGRWLAAREARIDGRVRSTTNFTGMVTEFEIPIITADPRKYGPTETQELYASVVATSGLQFPLFGPIGRLSFGSFESGGSFGDGYFEVENFGTAEMWSVYRVTGPSPGFSIVSDTSVIRYDAALPAGQTVTLSPYFGGRAVIGDVDVSYNLTRAGWAPIEPGQTRGFAWLPDEGSGAGMKLVVESPEGAWL